MGHHTLAFIALVLSFSIMNFIFILLIHKGKLKTRFSRLCVAFIGVTPFFTQYNFNQDDVFLKMFFTAMGSFIIYEILYLVWNMKKATIDEAEKVEMKNTVSNQNIKDNKPLVVPIDKISIEEHRKAMLNLIDDTVSPRQMIRVVDSYVEDHVKDHNEKRSRYYK